MSTHADAPRQPVYVWDTLVRTCHWLIFFSILALSVTGFYIGKPFVISAGPAGQNFTMGWMKLVHFYAAIVFSVSVFARISWLFFGTPMASWRQFVPTTKERRTGMLETLKFYMFLRAEPPPATGHNAMAGFAYIAVFGLYIVMSLTGLALYGASAHVSSYMRSFSVILPLVGGPQVARWIHHAGMWLILGFAVQHIYSSILMARVEKQGTIDSIFGGYKVVPGEEKPRG